MIMAKDSNNNYVKIEDIKQQNNFFNEISPIKFKGSGENLENYRIYGNTVNGESVGDRTGNLFDGDLQKGYWINTTDLAQTSSEAFRSFKIFLPAGTYTLSFEINVNIVRLIADGTLTQNVGNNLAEYTVTTQTDGDIGFSFRLTGTTQVPWDNSDIMLNEGSTALPYEPCGYRVPVTVTNEMDTRTTNIYLPEPLKMVGDEAEYVDYKEQKQHRVRKNLIPEMFSGWYYNNTGRKITDDRIMGSDYIEAEPGVQYTTALFNENFTNVHFLVINFYNAEKTIIGYYATSATSTSPEGTKFITVRTFVGDNAASGIFYYQLEKMATATNYEPYIEDTELDVTLPALPTLSGINTLSVETNTKPSKVWGKLSDPRDILYVKDSLGNILFSKYHGIEGEPPLIYKAKKAGTLIDYRIYGQTENGESVGDRTANLFANLWKKGYIRADNGQETQMDGFICSGFFPVEYGQTYSISRNINVGYDNVRGYRDDGSFIGAGTDVCDVSNPFPSSATKIGVFTVTNENVAFIRFNDFTNDLGMKYMIVKGTYTEQTMPDYEPYGYRVPVTVEGKNLLRSVASSQATDVGTTFTRNDDGSISVNADGTSSSLCIYRMGCVLDAGDYILTGRPTDNSVKGVRQDIYWAGVDAMVESGSGLNFTIDADHTKVTVRIVVSKNTVVDNVTFYPMIRKADIEDSAYEPYHDPINTNIYLPEQTKMVGDKAEYADYQEQKLHRVRKNLFQNTASSQTKNGVTFTVNNDGSVTCNGTASNKIFFKIGDLSLASQSYILTGCPSDGGNDSYALRCYKNGDIKGADVGNGFNINESIDGYIEIRIASGYTCNNLIFYPMIRKADITDDTYESYITNTELDVTLPALPTLSGINTLSVGTAVQPSKINIKGKIYGKIYGWHVDPDISNSSGAVTYLEDAREMFPASMRSTTFNYGSWKNAFFMPKPCMLKSNGKVDYYLDPNDYTKKLDGTASDISNPNYDGNAMMQWPKIWFKYVKGVKKGQGYFYVANYKADGNFHCWCNYDSEDNEIDHFYTAIYNGTSFANYNSSKTYVVNDFAIYNNKLYKCNTAIVTAESFDNAKWDLVSNTAPVINKMRSLSGIRLTNNNGNAQTTTTTEITRATANNTTSTAEWYIETFSDRLLINGLLVLMGKSLNTQAVFGRGLDTGGQPEKEAYVTGTLNDKGLFWGVTENGNSGVKIFGMENFWGCCWHRTAGLITNNHAVKLKLTYGTKDGSTVVGYNQTGNGYIDNGISPHSNGYVQKMSYNKYGFMPAVTRGSQSAYYADYHYQNTNYTGIIYALFGGSSADGLGTGAFYLRLYDAPESMFWIFAASLSCKPLLN